MRFNPIPTASQEVPFTVRRILEPMKDILERSFFSRGNERAVTRADLIALGLVTEDQLSAIEEIET